LVSYVTLNNLSAQQRTKFLYITEVEVILRMAKLFCYIS